MTWQAILLEAIKLAPEELPLLDQGLHAVMAAFAAGQTEAEAVAAARAVMESAVNALEAAEK